MEDETKTKRQLIAELIDARQQIDELENMISKYKESLEALRQNEERYQLLTTTLNDVIWTMNAAGELTYISPSVEHQQGYLPHELVNKSFEITMTPASIDNIRKIIEDVFSNLKKTYQGAVTGHVEWEGLKKDGSIIWIDVSYVAQYTPSGELIFSGINRDITERKQAALERERLIRELQQALSDVKTLSGLLPICANCKKIRDDKGYWNQLESYISEHTAALFSHGICPECAKQLYPDFYNRIK